MAWTELGGYRKLAVQGQTVCGGAFSVGTIVPLLSSLAGMICAIGWAAK